MKISFKYTRGEFDGKEFFHDVFGREIFGQESPATHLDDPVAARIAWSQLSNSNLAFRTGQCRLVSGERVKIGPSLGLIGMVGVICLVVLVGHTGLFFGGFSSSGALIGIALTGVLLFVFRQLILVTVFDKRRGRFWNAWRGTGLSAASRASGSIDEIHALQMIGRYLPRQVHRRGPGRTSISGGFTRYELNLVLKDGSRLHLMAHGHGDSLRRDAEKLASFLGKPLWEYDFPRNAPRGMRS